MSNTRGLACLLPPFVLWEKPLTKGFPKVRLSALKALNALRDKRSPYYTGVSLTKCSIQLLVSLEEVATVRWRFLSFDSCSSFWRKYSLPPKRESLLSKEAKESFAQCDREIFSIADFRKDHIARVANLTLASLDDFQELEGKHGPGAVCEGHKANQKWLAVMSGLSDLDRRLDSIGYDLPYGLFADRLSPSDLSSILPSESAKLVTVPKTCTALRTITVEPVLNQFVQQALNTHLRNEIERCSVMRNCLTLKSQEPNQKLALEGSLTGAWVTVDLSSASDLLSTELVETCFAGRPKFLSAILGCRTPTVRFSNTELTLRKYAGMGNATTFPIQSYAFAIVALASMIGTQENLSIGKLRHLARSIRVFGDDIVIRQRYFPSFAEWIVSCGLRINYNKTFSRGNFRESCGVDAYKGTKVTPVYLRSDPLTSSTDASSFVSVLSTCNQLWLQGMYSTSDVLKYHLEKRDRLNLVPQDCQGLGLHTHQNLVVSQRWSATLHRPEIRALVPCPVRDNDRIDGYAALMKFFHTPKSAEYDRNHLSSSVRRFNINLRKRWVPV